jgi:hypothetical protein
MAPSSERKIGAVFGLLGAALIALDGVLDVARGIFYAVVGRHGRILGPIDQALIFFVIAIIIALFSILGGMRREGRAIAAGVVLIVIAIFGWLALGFGYGLLAILGALLTLIAGIVLLASA